MAIVKIICTCKNCGSEFEIRKAKRNRAEADSFKAWAIENITECRECRARRAHEEAMQEAEGLPQLTGSEKQISWAVDIRARVIRIIKSQNPYQLPDLDAVLKVKTKAGWWIDERGRDESTLIDDAVKNDPQLEDRRREIVEEIREQIEAEIETIAEAGTLKNCDATPEEIRAQLVGVRACYQKEFLGMQLDRFISWYERHHRKCGVYELTRNTLRQGLTWDAAACQWVR